MKLSIGYRLFKTVQNKIGRRHCKIYKERELAI